MTSWSASQCVTVSGIVIGGTYIYRQAVSTRGGSHQRVCKCGWGQMNVPHICPAVLSLRCDIKGQWYVGTAGILEWYIVRMRC